MIDLEGFRKHAHEAVDWMADYLRDIESLPVKPQLKPGSIMDQLPGSAPELGESIDAIMADFKSIILPGMTHWQSPNFFAYFPGNSSFPSVLGEMLTATVGAQCMSWDTSPAAAELEEKMMAWIAAMIGLPPEMDGVIQDTASTATLTALLTAREKVSGFRINESGFQGFENLRVYASEETHSSIEKAVGIAGFGRGNLVKAATDNNLALKPEALKAAIESDLKAGFKPACVVATLGTTGTTAVDPLKPIAEVCREHSVWLHVDAAFAGTALVLPEFRWMIDGIEQVDSFVFNPHKWMFTNFDCSAYFVRDREALLNTFEILPEYLKTGTRGTVNNYRDWGIPLGRRFRALKLWFVIRHYGIEGLQSTVRKHIKLAKDLGSAIDEDPDFECMTPVTFNLVCFRFKPQKETDDRKLDTLNEQLLTELNRSGAMYMSHTRVRGSFAIRLVVGQTRVEARHVKSAWSRIRKTAIDLMSR